MTTNEICGILSRNLNRDYKSKKVSGIEICVSIIMGKSGVKDQVKEKRIEGVIIENSTGDFYDYGSVRGDMEIVAGKINEILIE